MSQTMTWRYWVNSQVLRTVQTLHQEGPKYRTKRPRSHSLKSKRHLPDSSSLLCPKSTKRDKTWKITLRHVSDRGVSMKKQGARQHDVKPVTLKKHLLDFPDQFLQVHGDQLYCGSCCPPECLLNIINTTYDDDQKSSYTDYRDSIVDTVTV